MSFLKREPTQDSILKVFLNVWRPNVLRSILVVFSMVFTPPAVGHATPPIPRWAKVCAQLLTSVREERKVQASRRNSSRIEKLIELVILDGSRLTEFPLASIQNSDSIEGARRSLEQLGRAGVLAQFFGDEKMANIERQRRANGFGLRQLAHLGTVQDLTRLNKIVGQISSVKGAENLPPILELLHRARYSVGDYQKLFETYVPPPYLDGPLCFIRREHVWRELISMVREARQEIAERHLRLNGVSVYHLRRRLPRRGPCVKIEMVEELARQTAVDPELAMYVEKLRANLNARYAHCL